MRPCGRKMREVGVRALLADGCPFTRDGLKDFLLSRTAVEVVGEASNDAEALDLASRLQPDVVVLDPCLGGGSFPKIDACHVLKALSSPPHVVAYTHRNSAAYVAALALACVDHYVHKSLDNEGLEEVLRRMGAGETVWMMGLSPEETRRRFLLAKAVERLTAREKEVFELVLNGCSNREIAEKAHVSLQTAKNHVGHILHKLPLKDRAELFAS